MRINVKEIKLFKTKNDKWLTHLDLLEALESVKAYDCNLLYIHSELNFGVPNSNLKKNEILEIILNTIKELKVQTLCIPTFTFSFCNGEIYNREKSKSKMGIFNEFIRKQPDSVRSIDPLLSVAILGKDKSIITDLGHNSVGKNSHFDKIHNLENVRFLFLGPKVGSCFTQMHYYEERLNAPFRYNRDFSGKIIIDNKEYVDTYTLFVRYEGVVAQNGSYIYEDKLYDSKISKRVKIGNGQLTCFNEKPAFEIFKEMFNKNYNIFLREPYNKKNKNKKFEVKNMVAL